MAPQSSNQRPKILDAAFAVVSTQGSTHLTIDAVADAAGVSKGGFLYHFPNKQALLLGMLERMLDRYATTIVDASLLPEHVRREQHQTPQEAAAGLAILAAASEDPSLLDPARTRINTLFKDVRNVYEDGELAQLLLLAVEGMRFLKMLKLWPLVGDDSDSLQQRLSALASALEASLEGP